MIPHRFSMIVACSVLGTPAPAGDLTVTVGAPVLVDRYEGSETDANQQTHHFCGLLRAGNGNLIALYRLRPDEILPGDLEQTDYFRDDVGYRLSTDDGRTWSAQRTLSRGGLDGGTLADGTTLLPFMRTARISPTELGGVMHVTRDGVDWRVDEDVRIRFPDDHRVAPRRGGQGAMWWWVTTIISWDQRRILATMNGLLEGRPEGGFHRTVLLESTDGGHTWRFVSVIAARRAPSHQGYYGAGLVKLDDGSLLAVCQTEFANPRIIVQCRSADGGLTWSDPKPCPGVPRIDPSTLHYETPDGRRASFSGTHQHPRLLRLANGVLVLTYGRPGIQVAFSADGRGERWDHVETILPLGYRYSYGVYDCTSGKPGIVPLGPDRIGLYHDIYSYAVDPSHPRVNTSFFRTLTAQPAAP